MKMKIIDFEKILGFITLFRYDLFVRMAELEDAEMRMYLCYAALAPFKDGASREVGVVDITFDELLAGPLKTWSKSSASRTRASLIRKGWLTLRGKRLIVVNHYPLYKAKMKDMKRIILQVKPGVALTDKSIAQAEQNTLCGLNVDKQKLLEKLTKPP
ncbi:MAG: hypothetical protein WC666_02360 [Candidatus Paceibacterota bacterium]|jgi:hypothetical protein